MPRIPGTRIESPATLGRKCWAFAYLKQIWNPLKIQIQQVFANTGLSLDKFTNAYDNAVPETMTLCSRVMANCFINASFDPSRNGTCSDSVGQFFVGFQVSRRYFQLNLVACIIRLNEKGLLEFAHLLLDKI